MNELVQVHYFSLSSQANIYTLTILHLANNTNKLLVASLRREVYYFEYLENVDGILMHTAKEISFTYIPSGAEIISMDAFNRSETKNDFVIGITIIKNSNDLNALETYLNIYSEWEESEDFNIDTISQNRLNTLELKFIPYHLTHTFLIEWNEDETYSKEVVFLLSGSDNQIHVYRETSNHTFKEIECNALFPELIKPPSIITWVDTHYFNNYEERITAFGCECGYVRLCRISTISNDIIFNYSTRFSNSIASTRFYLPSKNQQPPPSIKTFRQTQLDEKIPVLNLIVTNNVLPAAFFGDVIEFGLKKCSTLRRYELSSVLTCVEVGDVDLDGMKEIMIGTSGQEIMLHKFEEKRGWNIVNVKKFPAPIMGIKYVDLTGDGLKELIVLTLKGIHIFQLPFALVDKAIANRINDLTITEAI